MPAESVAINHRGYTDELYETCGHPRCTGAVLAAVGVNLAGREPGDISNEPVGEEVHVSVLLAGETDYDVWCAACGDFIRHGLECGCNVGDDGLQPDRAPQSSPHINLKDAPSIQALWN
ncbi:MULTISPECIES: hypothetical protein [Mycolicibacter]|uniref:Uncharacterized protein n=2 Tax=Mycolicibacter TaxID=1073531 RepID=A0ABU5XM69_9MYCO|nr:MULTISPECIES: hypothetical protein [unclassified Mycolicibacter]MEB3023380.1 hypothetical protein [Mycolicibacter sp. MYC098]MEB3033722.1 hypothetical protein [Mycolicibacter sp. MYC340]